MLFNKKSQNAWNDQRREIYLDRTLCTFVEDVSLSSSIEADQTQ